ncbi:MAG: sugar ABC transporter permease [Clostridiales bacterium]|nr:sugar ABC transporter permease [Clostridiales bacterium]
MKENVWKLSILSLVGVSILMLLPLLYAEFKHINNVITDPQKYIRILGSFSILVAIKNTVIFILITIPITVVLGFIIAYLVSEMKHKRIVGIAIITPIFLPSLVIGIFFKFLYSSIFYEFVNQDIYLMFIFIWSTIGYVFLFYYVSLLRRERSIEEAAALDGASEARIFFSVIVPTTHKTTVLSLVFTLYNAVRVFRYSYSLWGEFPDISVYMIQNSLHNNLKELKIDYLMTAANIFMIFIVMCLLLIFSYEKYSKRNEGI